MRRLQSALDEIVRRARFHRLDIYFMFAETRQQNNRRLAAPFQGFLEQLNAVFRAQPVIQQANIVLIARHRFQPKLVRLEPLQLKPVPFESRKQTACQNVIILIVLHQKHPYMF